MRHDHHEFLTAVSPTDIAASCVSFKYFGKCFQDLITGVVSEGIVDLFKAVQIGDNDPERIIMSGGAADFARPQSSMARRFGKPVKPSVSASFSSFLFLA